jgi:hypothetical protein
MRGISTLDIDDQAEDKSSRISNLALAQLQDASWQSLPTEPLTFDLHLILSSTRYMKFRRQHLFFNYPICSGIWRRKRRLGNAGLWRRTVKRCPEGKGSGGKPRHAEV